MCSLSVQLMKLESTNYTGPEPQVTPGVDAAKYHVPPSLPTQTKQTLPEMFSMFGWMERKKVPEAQGKIYQEQFNNYRCNKDGTSEEQSPFSAEKYTGYIRSYFDSVPSPQIFGNMSTYVDMMTQINNMKFMAKYVINGNSSFILVRKSSPYWHNCFANFAEDIFTIPGPAIATNCKENGNLKLTAIYSASLTRPNKPSLNFGMTAQTDFLWSQKNNPDDYVATDLGEIKTTKAMLFNRERKTALYEYEEEHLHRAWASSFLRGMDKFLIVVHDQGLMTDIILYNVNAIPSLTKEYGRNRLFQYDIGGMGSTGGDSGKLHCWKKWDEKTELLKFAKCLEKIKESFAKTKVDGTFKYFILKKDVLGNENLPAEVNKVEYDRYQP